jgi:hypothetical protein
MSPVIIILIIIGLYLVALIVDRLYNKSLKSSYPLSVFQIQIESVFLKKPLLTMPSKVYYGYERENEWIIFHTGKAYAVPKEFCERHK